MEKRLLGHQESVRLLSRYKIPYVESSLVRTYEQCLAAVKRIGYPVALKLVSPEIVHKTEQKAVRLNIAHRESLADAFRELMTAHGHMPIEGILVQKMIPGKEIIVGMKRDPTFGPVLMFGMGGIFVEVLKDVAFRIPPINAKEAHEMMLEIKAAKVLQGVRGEPPLALEKIGSILQNTGRMVLMHDEIVELDFNPVMASGHDAKVVDARIMVS